MLTEAQQRALNKTLEYWQNRELDAQERLTNKSIKETEKQLAKYYRHTSENLQGQFLLTYKKVFEEMEMGKQPTPADLYKLDKYWKLQGQLKAELEKLGEKQIALYNKRFMEQYRNIYNSLALKYDTNFNALDDALIQQAINNIWCADGQSWSNRVWHNTEKLQQALNDSLLDCLLRGGDTNKLKEMLQYEFNVDYNRADTIVRTEMAHLQTTAAQQRYIDAGIEKVMVWADEDERRCDVCGKLHEKVYSIHEQMPIPAHPKCRCRIIAIVE